MVRRGRSGRALLDDPCPHGDEASLAATVGMANHEASCQDSCKVFVVDFAAGNPIVVVPRIVVQTEHPGTAAGGVHAVEYVKYLDRVAITLEHAERGCIEAGHAP